MVWVYGIPLVFAPPFKGLPDFVDLLYCYILDDSAVNIQARLNASYTFFHLFLILKKKRIVLEFLYKKNSLEQKFVDNINMFPWGYSCVDREIQHLDDV